MTSEQEVNKINELLANVQYNGEDQIYGQTKETENMSANGLSEIKKLITELSVIRKEYKHTSDMLDTIKEKKTQLEDALFIALENAGLQNVKGEDGTTFFRKVQLFANVKVDDKPTFFQWLRDHEMGDIIKTDIHAKTLTAFVKEQLEHENELPDYVTTFSRTTIGYRGGK